MPEIPTTRRDAKPRKPHFKYAVMYAHRGEGDAWAQVFAENLRRLRKQRGGKPNARGPVPVIVGDEDGMVAMEERRLAAIEEQERMIVALEAALRRCGQGEQPDRDEMAHLTAELNNAQERSDAAKLTDVHGPAALKDLDAPEQTKLEVVHHGQWGSPNLHTRSRAGSTPIAIGDLPSRWRALGLSRKIGSVRLLSCGSGDAAPRDRLISYPQGYYGPPADGYLAPAQLLADKMKAAGFVRPRVTGYQGLGLGIPSYLHKNVTYVKMLWAQDVSLPEEAYGLRVGSQGTSHGTAITDIARRSDVAMVFEPTDHDRRGKRLRYEHAYMYAPNGESETFEFALEENVRRLAKWIDASYFRPRGPIPLLAVNDEVRETLAAVRAKRMRELSEEVKHAREECAACEQALNDASLSNDGRDEKRKKIDELNVVIKERSFYLAAAEATEIKGLGALTSVKNAARLSEAEVRALRNAQLPKTKLYIPPLHGSAGSDVLTTDRTETPTEVRLAEISHDLAQHFLSEGLAPHIGSFRLLSSESADAKPRRKFETNPPGYSGLFSNRRVAPAQYLANKLQDDGFADPKVTGYQGQGVFWPVSKHLISEPPESAGPSSAGARHQGWGNGAIAPIHALQIIPGHSANWKRRREVGKVFTPKRQGTGLLCL